jgi:hypothetical protein
MKIRNISISARQWKIVLWAVLLLCTTLCATSLANWQQVLKPGTAATLRVDSDYPRGHDARIRSIEPDSPLVALGVKAGDVITFDERGDAWRIAFDAHAPVGMTIGTGGARRHVDVLPRAETSIDRGTATGYVLIMANAVVALALAGLIGLRRASSPSARLLALVLLIETSFASQFMAGGALLVFARLFMAPLVAIVGYCGLFMFSCRFPNDESAHVPAWVRLVSVPLILCYLAYTALATAHQYQWITVPASVARSLPVMVVLFVVLSIVNLWQAFRQSSGAVRQRVQWVGIAIGVRFALLAVGELPGLPFLKTTAFAEVQIVITILANIALAYGILRHRVFDVGFAVNRALVYAIVSVVLLVSFGLMEWLAHHFVSPEEAEKNALLDAGIALGLYLVFHRLRHSVEHVVERLFFHAWHANEERLRCFVRQAAHVSSPEALIEAALAALQRFSGGAGCALYRLHDGSGYRCAGRAGIDAPQTIGIDDPLAVALRADAAPLAPADCDSQLPGALALPMRFRGELQGFLLLGQKTNGGAYRPDEIAVLAFCAHQVGLDLQALRTEQLQAEVARLGQELGAYARAFELNKAARLPDALAALR